MKKLLLTAWALMLCATLSQAQVCNQNDVFGFCPSVDEVRFIPLGNINKYRYSEAFLKEGQTNPTCRGTLKNYLLDSLQFPNSSFQEAIYRRMYFNVTIAPDGTLSKCQPSFNETDSLCNACVACLSSFQGWIPSQKNGKEIASQGLVIITVSGSFHDPYKSVSPDGLSDRVPDTLKSELVGYYLRMSQRRISEHLNHAQKEKLESENQTFFQQAMALDSVYAQYHQKNIQNDSIVKPSFPGGFDALMAFLSKTVTYPAFAYEHPERNMRGRVMIRFVVDTDGSIIHPTIVQSAHPAFDAEAMRVISKMPKWNPATQNGEPKPISCTVPISFNL